MVACCLITMFVPQKDYNNNRKNVGNRQNKLHRNILYSRDTMDEFPLSSFSIRLSVYYLWVSLKRYVRCSIALLFNLTACNGRLIVHAVIRQMAGVIGPRSYFRFFQNKSVMPACTNNKTSTATYNELLMSVQFTDLALFPQI